MSDGFVLSTPESIEAFRLLSLRGMLKLECKGMKHSSGRSITKIVKTEFGLKGHKTRVLEQYESILRERGILQ